MACQPCPLGASCDGAGLIGNVPGSVWVEDWSSGQYRLVSCPPGYELLNTAGDENAFSATSQQCSLCPSSSYCIGGSVPSAACPQGLFSPAGANSSQFCVYAVLVELTINLPMAKTTFDAHKQLLFSMAIARAINIKSENVVIESISQERRSNNGSIQVVANIAVSSEATASIVVSQLSQSNINSQLQFEGLPAGQVQSVIVLNSIQTTSMLPVILGASLGGFAILFVASLCLFMYIRWKKAGASRRLMGAKFNTPANQRDLPDELRKKYEATRVLGSGAFGVVLEAHQNHGGKKTIQRAIKVIHSQGRRFTDKELRRLDREVSQRLKSCDLVYLKTYIFFQRRQHS